MNKSIGLFAQAVIQSMIPANIIEKGYTVYNLDGLAICGVVSNSALPTVKYVLTTEIKG